MKIMYCRRATDSKRRGSAEVFIEHGLRALHCSSSQVIPVNPTQICFVNNTLAKNKQESSSDDEHSIIVFKK